MTEKFSSSRFLLWEKPVAYPFYDLLNRSSEGPVFDLSVELNSYDGSVYLKAEHVIEMARHLGMATVEEVADLMQENLRLQQQIDRLPVAQRELQDGLMAITSKFYSDLRNSESDVAESFSIPAEDDRESAKAERETIGFADF